MRLSCVCDFSLLNSCFFPHWKENLTKQKHKNTGALFAVLAWPYMALFDLLLLWFAADLVSLCIRQWSLDILSLAVLTLEVYPVC